jgi:hypothetical protein
MQRSTVAAGESNAPVVRIVLEVADDLPSVPVGRGGRGLRFGRCGDRGSAKQEIKQAALNEIQ